MREKIHSYLGLAKRSGGLLSGYNSCLHGIKKGKAYLIIVTNELSENTKRKFSGLSQSSNVPFRIFGTIENMQEMTGEAGRGIYVVTEKNLANAILNEIDKSGQSG